MFEKIKTFIDNNSLTMLSVTGLVAAIAVVYTTYDSHKTNKVIRETYKNKS